MTRDDLITAARAFSAASGLRLSTVGKRAANHGGLFARIEAGGDISTARCERVMQWLAANWPAGHEMPASVRARITSAPAE